MPQATYKTAVDAPFERVLALLTDKMEKPRKYVGSVVHSSILERGDGFLIREMYEAEPSGHIIKEKIFHYPVAEGEEFVYEHMNNARYTGVFRNVLTRAKGLDNTVELQYAMDWTPHAGTEEQLSAERAQEMVKHAVLHMKNLAENPVHVPDWVRDFFAAVDALDHHAMGELLDEHCSFRMANGPEVLGRTRIVANSELVCKQISGMQHDYVSVHTAGETTFVESYVDYILPTGAKYLLPFLTAFGRKNGRIVSVKVFGDPSPLRYGW